MATAESYHRSVNWSTELVLVCVDPALSYDAAAGVGDGSGSGMGGGGGSGCGSQHSPWRPRNR